MLLRTLHHLCNACQPGIGEYFNFFYNGMLPRVASMQHFFWVRHLWQLLCTPNSIGSFAFVGARALMNANVRNDACGVGVSACQIWWMSGIGELLDLPFNGNGQAKHDNTGELYVLGNIRSSKVCWSNPILKQNWWFVMAGLCSMLWCVTTQWNALF